MALHAKAFKARREIRFYVGEQEMRATLPSLCAAFMASMYFEAISESSVPRFLKSSSSIQQSSATSPRPFLHLFPSCRSPSGSHSTDGAFAGQCA
jgi:hypothetical protein